MSWQPAETSLAAASSRRRRRAKGRRLYDWAWSAISNPVSGRPRPLIRRNRLRQIHSFFRNRSPSQMLATAAPSKSPACLPVMSRTSGMPLSLLLLVQPTSGDPRRSVTAAGLRLTPEENVQASRAINDHLRLTQVIRRRCRNRVGRSRTAAACPSPARSSAIGSQIPQSPTGLCSTSRLTCSYLYHRCSRRPPIHRSESVPIHRRVTRTTAST
jgi:hypothetical protein